MSAQRKPKLREFIVRTRETRSFDVDYVVKARNEDEARDVVSGKDCIGAIVDETAMLNSIDRMEISSLKENM